MANVVTWFAAWILIIVALFGLSRSKAGHAAIYYTLWLLVILMIVTHFQQITSTLQSANIANAFATGPVTGGVA